MLGSGRLESVMREAPPTNQPCTYIGCDGMKALVGNSLNNLVRYGYRSM